MTNPKRYFIDKIGISIVNLSTAVAFIEEFIAEKKWGYVCVTEERTAYIANHDEQYCNIQNNSLITVPDGMPLVWIAHNLGFKNVGRVSGLDFLIAILNISGKKNYSQYFYGSSPQTIQRIIEKMNGKYPDVSLKGAVSPPFQSLESFNIEELAAEINKLEPTFFWCGLGAPKQEKLIALLQPCLKSTICVGVGLAFEYFADTVIRAPRWAQKLGLEGFFRLYQQPQRLGFYLIRRYVFWLKVILLTKIFGNLYKIK